MEASVSLKKIGKTINKKSILAGLSFGIERGSIMSIVGPNDSGKSLLLKMISGETKPEFGSIFINGKDIQLREKEISSQIGYMPQYINFDYNLTILENFQFHGRIYGMNSKQIVERIIFLSEKIELNHILNQFPGDLSYGFKRKAMFLRSLLHDPSILLLDEPTLSLDLKSQYRFWKLINELKGDKTIIYTTQSIKESENIYERIIFLSGGKIVLDGNYDQLINKTADFHKFVITFEILDDKLYNKLLSISSVIDPKKNLNKFEFYGKTKKTLFDVLRKVIKENLLDCEISKVGLDTLYLNSTKE